MKKKRDCEDTMWSHVHLLSNRVLCHEGQVDCMSCVFLGFKNIGLKNNRKPVRQSFFGTVCKRNIFFQRGLVPSLFFKGGLTFSTNLKWWVLLLNRWGGDKQHTRSTLKTWRPQFEEKGWRRRGRRLPACGDYRLSHSTTTWTSAKRQGCP